MESPKHQFTKISSILLFIFFGIISLMGVVGIIGSMIEQEIVFPGAGTLTFSFAIIILVIGILGIFLTISLWKNKLWAKWLFAIISGLAAIEGVRELIIYPNTRNQIIVWIIVLVGLFISISLWIDTRKEK